MIKTWFNQRKVLVTGGAGFIGSHLVEQLVNLNSQVTVIDNLSTGKIENLHHVLAKITFVPGTIVDYETCMSVCNQQEIIFHLAAQVSVPESLKVPNLCYQTNVLGSWQLLEAARQTHVKRFIFSSSSAVYGAHEGICSEDLNCKPLSPYGYSKLMGEQLCAQYALNYGLNTVSLRYFNVFGPRQNANGPYAAVVAQFTEYMKNNKPITIYGDGLQQRDFISVNDVVQANLIAAIAAENNDHLIINIGSGKSISLLTLIETLKKRYPNYTASIIFQDKRAGDIIISQADCLRFEKLKNRFTTNY